MNCSPPGSSVYAVSLYAGSSVYAEYWSGLPFPFQGDLPEPGSNLSLLCLPYWQTDSLPLSHLESPRIDIGADYSLLYGCPATCRVFSSIPGFFSPDASSTPSSPRCANQGVSRCYQQCACPANYNLSQCHENLAVARLQICQPQVLNPERVRQASLSPPGLPRTDTWAPSFLDGGRFVIVCCFQGV